ncbi:heavy metal translocating P-type ATPase [Salinirubrum litoreum]|uniref:Heavy metal translocating P-type ATPase n=1 Tax=Salinirubrum litoreum TaxID=1126234 RepID=A0ABD5R6F0_9EURY|nr:heavy metal translocating P-type ATPase [Salinirubrum litoreum]
MSDPHGHEDGDSGGSAGGHDPDGDVSCGCASDDHAHDEHGGQSSGDAGDEGTVLRLSVPEMDCPSCAGNVESSVASLSGILDIDPRPATGTLVVTYDPEETTPDAIRDRVRSAGYEIESGVTDSLSVPEMDCPSCAGKVENALARVAGVIEFETRPTTGTVEVTYDPDATSRAGIVAAIEGAGYSVADADGDGSDDRSPHDVWTSTRGLNTWAGAILLAVGLSFEWFLPLAGIADPVLGTVVGREITVAWLAYLGAAAVAGQTIVRNGYYSAKNLNLDIDFLMGAGVIGALLVNLPFEAATLAVLFSVAELLERFSMDRARTSMRELMELSPDTATVRRDGAETTVPVESVAVGETVLVRPGEKIPLDGVVSEGRSAVDESPITGESVPRDVSPGDEVYGGSILAEGYLEVETTATAENSTLSKVVDLVEAAQSKKSERERFVDRFADIYTPAVVAAAILTTLASPTVFGVTWTEAFTRGLTLLVVACPCAFVISTPVSVVSGITSAARNGVLIKGGTYLEAMGSVDAVAFDKTGTLTTGELSVTDAIALDGTSETDLLGCARALESRSEHPIASAITEHADEQGVPDREIENFEALAGKGVRADLDGTTHYAGKPDLFADLGFDLGHAHVGGDSGNLHTDGGVAVEPSDCDHGQYVDLAEEVIPRLQSEGKTVVVVGTEDRLEGVIGVADTVRPESKWAVTKLRELGVGRIVMLTGDNERTAQVIGDQVGVDEVRAGLLPEEKVAAMEELTADGKTAAMVGDGVNDAPALAVATVGVAMGAAGTDTALETADVALMGDDLTRLPYLYDLSGKANGVIRGNIWSSLGVKMLLALGAIPGVVQVVHAVVIGDMGMSLAVTGNAMRLANVEPETPDSAELVD